MPSSASTPTPLVERLNRLSPDQVDRVRALTAAAGDSDGTQPLSEHVMLHLRHGGDAPAVHLWLEAGGDLVGYGHVDTTDEVEGASAEAVVHPMNRRRGYGRALVRAAIEVAEAVRPGGPLRLWAHGDHPSAGALALSLGFSRSRVLWQLRRSLYTPLPVPQFPAGVRLRQFEPGRDEAAWLAVNAAAFAKHPEQGRWDLAALRSRMAEPWFDPAGFLLAVDQDEQLLGFHWTKVHGEEDSHPHPPGVRPHHHDPIGEVYVVGVDPRARGRGLGLALTLAGLRHLLGRGLAQAMLYVDADNTPAVSLYRQLDFAHWSTDVSYRRG
jgi:mycothiol synthase